MPALEFQHMVRKTVAIFLDYFINYCVFNAGVSLYHSSIGPLANNSVIRADNGFLRGSIFCLSGRMAAQIGRWIAPGGDDYTLTGTHPFEVSVGGQNNLGVVQISVSGSDNRFPAGHWDGVYSCVIPDETGTEQRIYLGIYIVFGKLATSLNYKVASRDSISL